MISKRKVCETFRRTFLQNPKGSAECWGGLSGPASVPPSKFLKFFECLFQRWSPCARKAAQGTYAARSGGCSCFINCCCYCCSCSCSCCCIDHCFSSSASSSSQYFHVLVAVVVLSAIVTKVLSITLLLLLLL